MGLPQVPLGSHIRPSWQTDRNMQTHTGRQAHTRAHTCTHTVRPLPKHSLLLQYAGSHAPKAWHTLHKAVTLLYIRFFSDTKLFFTPLASTCYMEVLKWIMETTELKTHGIHLKMWERWCSQGLDCRNIMLQVNESAIVLYSMEMLL